MLIIASPNLRTTNCP